MQTKNSQNQSPNLHKQFVHLGRQKHKIQYQLLQLLPQIYKQKVYKKYCKTIEGYAWRFAQIPQSIVQKTLNLEKHLGDKPYLKAAVAEVGIHKVALVANIATAETDAIFADKVRSMSKTAIFELSRELRSKGLGNQNQFSENPDQKRLFPDLQNSEIDLKCQAKANTITLNLDEEMTFLFLKVKQQFEKNEKTEFSHKEILHKMLQSTLSEDTKKAHKANQLKSQNKILKQESQTFPGKNHEKSKMPHQKNEKADLHVQPSRITARYIPVHQKRLALQQSSHKCSYPNCNKPPEVFHHPERYSQTKNHQNLKPLCKEHHEFMHAGLIANEVKAVEEWGLKLDQKLNCADKLYQKYRNSS